VPGAVDDHRPPQPPRVPADEAGEPDQGPRGRKHVSLNDPAEELPDTSSSETSPIPTSTPAKGHAPVGPQAMG
jgi:hypothetical protein